MDLAAASQAVLTVNALARLGAALDVLGVPGAPLAPILEAAGAAPGRFLRVSVTHDLARVSAQLEWPGGDVAGALARAGCDPGAFLALPARARWLELATFAGATTPAIALHADTGRVAFDDVAVLAPAAALPDAARARFVARAATIAGRDGGALVSLWHEPGAPAAVSLGFRLEGDACAELPARLAHFAGELAITRPQLDLLDKIHPLFGKTACFVTLVAGPEGLGRARVEYFDPSWEDVVRLLLGLYPGARTPERLGAFAGALDAERPQSLELALGPSEPPGLRVSAGVVAR